MTERQMSLFDGVKEFKFTKPVRLIELFGGIGAQAKALERLGVDFEHYRLCEIDKYAVASYNAVHGTNFTTSDITKLHASDLGVTETDKADFDKAQAVNSNAQLYKQAGNSIVVAVLQAIFENMIRR